MQCARLGYVGFVALLALPGLRAFGGEAAEAAQEAEAKYYKAYYLESESRDLEEAIRLYAEVSEAPGVYAELAAEAKHRLAACREELRARDLSQVMPPASLAYMEVRSPGKHLVALLEAAGLGEVEVESAAGHLRVPVLTPALRRALAKVEGAALSIVDVDPRRGEPFGVLALNLGRDDLVRATVEGALSGGLLAGQLRPAEPVHGHPTYAVPQGSIVLTERLVVVSHPAELAAEVVERLHLDDPGGLAKSDAFQEIGAERDGAALFGFVDLHRLLEKAKTEMNRYGGMPQEYQLAQAFTDIESLRWAAMRVGGCKVGIAAEAWVRLADSNRALAYHLFRTPPVSKETLAGVPAGAAAFLAFGLSEAKSGPQPARGSGPPAITGLDLGREIFANVTDVVAYLLPDPPMVSGEGRYAGPVMPHFGVTFTVEDPAKSHALWETLLGLGALASGTAPTPVRSEQVEGKDVQIYTFPDSIEVAMAASGNRLVLGTTPAAVVRAIQTAEGGRSVLADPGFAGPASLLGPSTSKLLMVHGGRMFQMAQPFVNMPDDAAAMVTSALGEMTVALMTEETPASLRVRMVSGIPNVGAFAPVLWRELGLGPGFRGSPRAAVAVPDRGMSAAGVSPVSRVVIGQGDTPSPPPIPTWDASRTARIVEKGSTWKYSDNGSIPAEGWGKPGYDDGSWKSGPAPLGYGEDTLGTTVGFGGDPQAKHITTYFRRTFRIEDPGEFSVLRILLRCDDGAAIYLNGEEVARYNLPPGAGPDDPSPITVGGEWESAFTAHPVKPEALRPGDNSIAVEVHQANPTSSDVIFDLALEGLRRASGDATDRGPSTAPRRAEARAATESPEGSF